MADDNSNGRLEDIILENESEVPVDVNGSDIDEEYTLKTPEQKVGTQKEGSSLSSSDVSSDLSTKEGSETMSSSSSSSDAESGTYKLPVKKYLLEHVDGDEEDRESKSLESEVGGGGLFKETKDTVYEELLEKVANYEVELKFAKKKIECSQDEIARLKYENLTLVEELGRTIEKLRTSEDNMEKMERKLTNEFRENQDQFQGQLDLANQSIEQLQAELASERSLVSELQQIVVKTTNDLSDYGREIDELKLALHDAQEDFSHDRSQFQSEMIHLREQRDALDARLKEAEQKNELLEDQIRQYEVERVESRSLHEARETALLDEIKQLKVDLSERCETVDSLNKSLDACKLSYDMLMAEKDQVFAKVQKLSAELNSRDINISQLNMEHGELLAESVKTQKLVEELRLKVVDQEKELEKQRAVMSDRAEEKREAIRQLCFSLEYYRNGYHELSQAFIKRKQPVILAS